MWTSDGGKHPDKVEVVLQRRITGLTKDRSEFDSVSKKSAVSDQIVVPFDFALQIDDSVSYKGKTFELIWELVATADIAWSTDQTETRVITVKPATWTAEEYQRWCDDVGEDDEDDEEDDDADADDSDARN